MWLKYSYVSVAIALTRLLERVTPSVEHEIDIRSRKSTLLPCSQNIFFFFPSRDVINNNKKYCCCLCTFLSFFLLSRCREKHADDTSSTFLVPSFLCTIFMTYTTPQYLLSLSRTQFWFRSISMRSSSHTAKAGTWSLARNFPAAALIMRLDSLYRKKFPLFRVHTNIIFQNSFFHHETGRVFEFNFKSI